MRLFFLILLLVISNLSAQNNFDHLNTHDGLSQNTVLSICQDSFGYIWLGTKENGLNKFDGKTFIHYKFKPGQVNSLSSHRINELLPSKNGSVWIGSDKGLDFYNPSNQIITKAIYKNLSGIKHSFSNQFIQSLKKDFEGNIWVISTDKVFIKQPLDSIFQELNIFLESPIVEIEPLIKQQYLISSDKFVYLFDRNKGTIVKSDLIDYNKISHINEIYKDSEGNVFFGTNNKGFAVYIKELKKTLYFNKDNTPILKSGVIRTFCEGAKNEVNIGTFNGLYTLNTKSLKLVGCFSKDTDDTSLSHNSIQDVYKDISGNLWIGTYSGGVTIKHPIDYSFKTFRHQKNDPNSISSNVINTFYEDKYGLWIGTDAKGITLFRNNEFTSLGKNSTLSYVKAIHKKDEDRIFIGGHRLGIVVFNQKTNKIEKRGLQNYSIYDLQKDNKGRLWGATTNRGLFIVDQDNIELLNKTIKIPKSLSTGVKNLILDTSRDIMIISSLTKIFIYNFKLNLFFEVKKSPYTDSIYEICDVFLDSSNIIWVGTSDGILKITDLDITNGSCDIEKHDLDNVLNNNYIKSIKEDDNNDLWISTLNGLCRVSKDFKKIATYNRQYNIQGNEFINKSSFRSKNNLIWFGGNEGFTVFNPEKLEKNNYEPPLVFSNLTINNKQFSPNIGDDFHNKNVSFIEKLDLNYWEKNIVLTVSALNYIAPKRNKYKWTFSESNKVLIEGTSDIITLNNLKPGNYNLSITASNNDGLWIKKPLELEINVSSPIWKTKLAYFSYILLLALILLIFNRIYLNKKRISDELKLEKLDKIREKESQEEKLTFFTNISHEIRTPLTLISGPIDQALSISENGLVKKTLEVAKKHSDYLKDLTNELLDFRKVEKRITETKISKVDITSFIAELCELFEDSISIKDKTKIIFNSTIKEDIYINSDLIKKVLVNLLFNAHKHNVDNHDINVYLSKEFLPKSLFLTNAILINEEAIQTDNIVLTIEDKGKGIKKKNLTKLFNRFFQDRINNDYLGSGIGLAFIKMLVLKIDGQIKVETKNGEGTRFSILLPTAKAPIKENSALIKPHKKEDLKVTITSKESKDTDNTKPKLKTKSTTKKKYSILIVEDNKDLLDWMISFLSIKFNCIRAVNGKEGLKLAKKENPDVIISDVMMPKMDGYEMCKALKNDMNTSHIPLILLSAKAIDKSIEEGFLSGANSYIKKPFNPDFLVKRIENFIKLKDNIVKKYNTDYNDLSEIEKLSVYDKKILDKINKYLDQHISDINMNVESMAGELAMSRSTLYRKIKSLTKSSPNDYIRDYRLFIAIKLIKDKDLSINEVSEKVGFNDYYYFKRCFFKKFGVKPEEI